ncbi:MAG: hypothetical protein Q9184_005343, partial [Pyrenodesmia sp. 2 TL-2023]
MSELSYNTRSFYGHAEDTDIYRYIHEPTAIGAAFICLQEVLHGQLSDILHGLNGLDPAKKDQDSLPAGPLWAHIGVAREDGRTKGEYSPIIYPVQLFDLLHFENIWLSPTPDRPSKGWDAGSERIFTAGVFRSKTTGQRLIACCTHLDNVGSESRRKSVDVILQTIARLRREWSSFDAALFDYEGSSRANATPEIQQNAGSAVFLAGDFNSLPHQEAYLAMEASGM